MYSFRDIEYLIKAFFHKSTSTLTYVVWDAKSRDAVVLDAPLDYDKETREITFESVLEIIEFIRDEGLSLHHILETHAHADHLSAAQVLKREFPKAQVGIGAGIAEVQTTFKPLIPMDTHFRTDGSQFEYLFSDQETFEAGTIEGQVITTPGHTPACVSYLIGKHVFTGDALFMPDVGTGRCDFPGGSAVTMYQSIHEKLYRLPAAVEIFVGHDYPPATRDMQFKTTVGEQKSKNAHLTEQTSLAEYVQFRETRDKGLKPPQLLTPSLVLNLNAGILPKPDQDGRYFLTLPGNE